MAEKRMLSKVISISEKVNMLPEFFDMLLFTWMIPHTDDFGRLVGSPAKIKALVVPMLNKSIKEVEESLSRLKENKLIIWYEDNGEKVIEIDNFSKHQEGLKSKKKSKFSPPERHLTSSNSYLSASESDIEEILVSTIQNENFIDDEEIVSVDRQLRIDNSYLDIVATGIFKKYLFEVKRQRLSNASIEQILKYRGMLNDSNVVCTLIGNGLSSNFDMQRCKDEQINVVVYDESLNLDYPLLINVKYRHSKLLLNRTELNLTELEENRTEEKKEVNPYRLLDENRFPLMTQIMQQKVDCLIEEHGIANFVEAVEESVYHGKRYLPYVAKILENWQIHGKGNKESSGGGQKSKLGTIDDL